MPTELSPASRNGRMASIAASSIIATIAGVDMTAASDASRRLARSAGATVREQLPVVPIGIDFIDLLTSRAAKLASQAHRVEFLDDPFDAIVAPKWFAIDDEGRHAEDAVAIAGGERIGQFAWAVVKRVAVESVGVEARFLYHGGERGGVFNVEFAFEEALEDTVGVRAKQPVLVGPQPGHESQFRVEDFLRSADDHAARVRVTARVEVEVANFAPFALGPLVEIAAEGAADVEFVRDVMQA